MCGGLAVFVQYLLSLKMCAQQVDPELEIKAYYAGHVLGAAMFHIRVGSQSVVYTVRSTARGFFCRKFRIKNTQQNKTYLWMPCCRRSKFADRQQNPSRGCSSPLLRSEPVTFRLNSSSYFSRMCGFAVQCLTATERRHHLQSEVWTNRCPASSEGGHKSTM